MRRLAVGVQGPQPLAGLPVLIAALPRLESLTIKGRADYEALAHSGLTSLATAYLPTLGEPAQVAARLSAQALPALTALSFTGTAQYLVEPQAPDAPPVSSLAVRVVEDFDDVCDRLAARWLPRLARLALLDGALTDAGVAALERGLDGRTLDRLDLTGSTVPAGARAALAALCRELVLPAPVVEPGQATWVEHANKPEWGRGQVVRCFAGKLEVEFPGHGVKVFKADAPFLRLGI